MWTIGKALIEFVIIFFFLFYLFIYFWPWGMLILAPWLRNELTPSALDSEVPTTGPPGKSL